MATPTNFVLRWVINNARATLAGGEASSEEWQHEGFMWNITMKKSVDRAGNWADYTLQCGVDHDGPWNCDVEVNIYVLKGNVKWTHANIMTEKFHLNNANNAIQLKKCNSWTYLNSSEHYCLDNTITIEFRLTIVNSSGGCDFAMPSVESRDVSKFVSPIVTSNVTLVIGEKELVASKEYLAMHSPVFNKMFFGDFIEKNKKTIELKEIDFEEFVDLLQVIFPDGSDISDATVLHIAKLADRFLIKKVLHWCEKHLSASNKFTVEMKLQFADAYRFPKLMHTSLQTFQTLQQLKVFQNSPAYNKFSNDTKAAICDHIMIKLL